MEMERADIVSNRCKGNMVNIINLQSLREAIENGDIPDWLLTEVFIRLSTKLLCRFKLVSKHWLSTISDPSFRDYISRHSLVSQPWNFISHRMHHKNAKLSYFPEYELLEDIYSQVTKPSYCILPLPCTQQANGGEKYLICGVSNGLILYHLLLEEVQNYYICNPVTGQWISIPPVTPHSHTGACGFLTQVVDYVLKSYRVVRLDLLPERGNFVRFKVFFSESGEWKNFTFSVSSDVELSVSLYKEVTTFNGILHWIAHGHGLIAYDPYHKPEEMRIIAFPYDFISHKRGLCSTDACEGKLRLFQATSMHISEVQFRSLNFKLWVLNDYSSGDWYLQHNISHNDVQFDTNLSFNKSSILPISFHPFDSDVVYLGHGDLLITYNFKTRKLAVQQKCSTLQTFKQRPEWRWSFLLVIPPWPTSIRLSFSGADG